MPAPEAVLRGQAAAQELRIEHGLGTDPIVDLWGFIADLGVDLAFVTYEDAADGMYHWTGDKALIVVNRDRGDVLRHRFTAAHELGHHVMHGGRAGEAVDFVDQDLRSTSEVEREANAFAGHLLAPDAAMKAAFSDIDRRQIDAEQIAELVGRYGLSTEALIYRLHNCGRILSEDRDRLKALTPQINWRLRVRGAETLALIPGETLPHQYVLQVLELVTQDAIPIERAAELLRRDVAEVQALLPGEDERAPSAAVAEFEAGLGDDLALLLAADE